MDNHDLTQAEVEALKLVAQDLDNIAHPIDLGSLLRRGLIRPDGFFELTDKGRAVVEAVERGRE